MAALRRAAAVLPLAVFVACESGKVPSASSISVVAPFDEVFATESVITLGEDPADSIAEVGAFTERRAGGFVIGDRLLPRVRSYGEDGQLEAAFGRFGDGPFEFRRINSVVEKLSGQIVVPNYEQNNLTVLTATLQRDTLLRTPGPATRAMAIGSDLLVRMIPLDGREARTSDARPPILHRMIGDSLAWSSYEIPFTMWDRPYWGSLVPIPITVAGDSIFAMSGARFPITILNGAGDTVGAMGSPSKWFRPIPILEAGAFANLAEYGTTLPEILTSFEIIERMDVVGPHLILTRARADHTRPLPPFKYLHTHLDIYDRHTGVRLYEHVPLPEGSKVLGGGRFLYLLLNKDFPPWRIAKLRLRD